jgi:acyl dehydratase
VASVTTREVQDLPSMRPLYAKAAISAVPGASLLPFVGGRADDTPDIQLVAPGVKLEAGPVARYDEVCGFSLRDELPPTYLHVLAFPLQMALMTDGSFPFPVIGLVHIENRIEQHRSVRLGETVSLRVSATPVESHPKGRKLSLVSEVRVGDELVWEESSTYLRRGSGGDGAKRDGRREPELRATAEWSLPADLGRRYAAVSGDRNPIHVSRTAAKLFGFPRRIAHGMWTKARCLAALEGLVPDAHVVEARFRAPVLLPSKVAFGSSEDGGRIRFVLRKAGNGKAHLDGTIVPKGG